MASILFEPEAPDLRIEGGLAHIGMSDGEHVCTVATLRKFAERARALLAKFEGECHAPVPLRKSGGR